MILVADGWKRCSRCLRFKRTYAFGVRTRRPDGSPLRWQSACRKCARERQREIRGSRPRRRRPLTPQQRQQAYLERLYADDERLEARRADQRMSNRLARDLARGGPPKPYPLRRTLVGIPVLGRYRPPSRYDGVPAAPLCAFLRQRFPHWEVGDLGALIGHEYERGLYRVLVEGHDATTLDFIDRLLTKGLGRPDLLNALYPLESR